MMRRMLPLALCTLAASCAPAPVATEPEPREPAPPAVVEAPPEPEPAPPAKDLATQILAEADRLFTDASRTRTAGHPEEAAELYTRSLALYETLNRLAPSPALATRADNARAARTAAAADAQAAARAQWKTEILASLPEAPFPDDASILKHFEDRLARNPDDRSSRRRLASLYLADERYPEAAALLDTHADAEPVFELARAALYYRLGRNDDAVARVDDVRRKWRRVLPLQILRPHFCLTPPLAFDRFTPAPSTAFFPGQKLWIYFEAGNATCAPVDGGKWKVALACDYEILDAEGRTVAWPEAKDYARDYDPPLYGTPVNDICLMLGVKLPQVGRGKYTLVLRLTDKQEAKNAEARMEFEIR